MIDCLFGRYVLGVCAAVPLLAGCGGSQPPIGASGALDPHGKKQSQTFNIHGRGADVHGPNRRNSRYCYCERREWGGLRKRERPERPRRSW